MLAAMLVKTPSLAVIPTTSPARVAHRLFATNKCVRLSWNAMLISSSTVSATVPVPILVFNGSAFLQHITSTVLLTACCRVLKEIYPQCD